MRGFGALACVATAFVCCGSIVRGAVQIEGLGVPLVWIPNLKLLPLPENSASWLANSLTASCGYCPMPCQGFCNKLAGSRSWAITHCLYRAWTKLTGYSRPCSMSGGYFGSGCSGSVGLEWSTTRLDGTGDCRATNRGWQSWRNSHFFRENVPVIWTCRCFSS